MVKSSSLLIAVLYLALISRTWAGNAEFVDPRMGTEGQGFTIIGPAVPFGMAKPGPDTGNNDQNSGWGPKGDINGFSQTHVSGTGGGAKYGNILVQPTVGPMEATPFGSPRANENATLGYYSVELTRFGVKAEITTAARAALYRFTYPENTQSHLTIDVGHCLSSHPGLREGQKITASAIQVLSSTEMAGFSSATGGWNKQTNSYTVYFYAVTDTPSSGSGTWEGTDVHPGSKEANGENSSKGAWLDFSTHANQVIQMKIGISFVSIEQAKANALNEIKGFDFEGTKVATIKAWDEALSTVQVTGGTLEQRKIFFSSIYHTMLMPVDRTGDNPLWQSDEPYYDDFYTIWDTFRSSSPLLTLLAQDRQVQIIRALVDIYRHDHFLPDGRSGNFNGRTQGGSNADILIADGYVKGLSGIDWPAAYAAVVQDAEVAPVDQFKEGRGGLDDWKNHGYCSVESVDRSGCKNVEYAYNDFCIGEIAKGLGKGEDAAKYNKRAGQWRNVWDAGFSEGGYSGFIRPKHRDGTWRDNFTAMQGCSWGGDSFYEGNSWTYSFFVPQDMALLVQKCGGPETFVKRLNDYFTVPKRCDITDEPYFLIPYLYIWGGRQDKTCERVHDLVTKHYHLAANGVPGNDDSGAMGSLYAFSAMGIFPVAGQPIYLIGSPIFSSSTLGLANGHTLTIEAKNVSDKNIYVTSASLNDKPLNQAWLRHADLMAGGKLTLEMGSQPGSWPTGPVPPSPLSNLKTDE